MGFTVEARRNRTGSLLVAGLLVVATVLVLAGCGSSEDGGTGGTGAGATTETTSGPTDTTGSAGDSTSGMLAAPGLYDLSDGRTQALGVLRFIELEGGFWAVTDEVPGEEEPAQPEVVAVIANAEELGVDLEAMEGSYVAAEGGLLEGASIRMAGPEIQAESLEVVQDTDVIEQTE